MKSSLEFLIAFQQVTRDYIKFENGTVDIDFSFAGKMLRKLVKIVLKKGLPDGIDLLNVNIPENPVDKNLSCKILETECTLQ